MWSKKKCKSKNGSRKIRTYYRYIFTLTTMDNNIHKVTSTFITTREFKVLCSDVLKTGMYDDEDKLFIAPPNIRTMKLNHKEVYEIEYVWNKDDTFENYFNIPPETIHNDNICDYSYKLIDEIQYMKI